MLKVQGDVVVVADPELAFSKAGKPWIRLRCVSNDRKKDSNGQWVDGDPSYFDLVAFGKVAEAVAESDVGKGTRLTIVGNLTIQEWETDDGQKRTTVKVMADHIGLELLFTPYRKVEGEAPRSEPAAADAPF